MRILAFLLRGIAIASNEYCDKFLDPHNVYRNMGLTKVYDCKTPLTAGDFADL
jgi:hypothetical protein